MFPGFFVGTICLFWLVRTMMWGPRYRYHGWRHRSWGPGPYAPSESLWGDFGTYDRPGRPRDVRVEVETKPRRDGLDDAVSGFVRALRDRLRATPEQERAFDSAVRRLRDAIDDVQGRVKEARDNIAQAVRGEYFDDSAFDQAARRIEQAMQAVREAAKTALADVHDRLDERQRATLSDLIGSSRFDL
jgi:hypothetical protein